MRAGLLRHKAVVSVPSNASPDLIEEGFVGATGTTIPTAATGSYYPASTGTYTVDGTSITILNNADGFNGGSKFGELTGVAGDCFTTPDSALNSVKGDIDIIVSISADYTPASELIIISKYNTTGNQRSYEMFLNATTGEVGLRHSTDGVVGVTSTSTVATGLTDGVTSTIRVTRTASSGDVVFYVGGVKLGATVPSAAGVVFDGTAPVTVGCRSNLTSNPFTGSIYSAIVYDGFNYTAIGGESVQDFEELQHVVPFGETAEAGTRVVQNYALNSESLLQWATSVSTIVSQTNATFDTALGKITSPNLVNYFTGGDTLACRVLLSGDGGVTLRFQDDDSVSNDTTNFTLTATPTWYTLGYTLAAGAKTFLNLVIDRNNRSATNVTFGGVQYEKVNGQAVIIPSEYVSRGVGTGDDLINTPFTASSWGGFGGNTVEDVDVSTGEIVITYVDNTTGAYLDLGALIPDLEADTDRTWVISGETKVNTGEVNIRLDNENPDLQLSFKSTSYVPFTFSASYDGSGNFWIIVYGTGAGETMHIKNLSIKASTSGFASFSTYNGNTVEAKVLTDVTGESLPSYPHVATAFDAGDYVTGPTWSSLDVDEVWTVNGGASIVGDTSRTGFYYSVPTVIGKQYVVEVTGLNDGNMPSGSMKVRGASYETASFDYFDIEAVDFLTSVTFTATTVMAYINVMNYSTAEGYYGSVDRVSVVDLPDEYSGASPDGSIENVENVLGTFYASVSTQNSGEADRMGKLVTTVQYTIQMRYNSTDLTGLAGNATIVINGVTPVLEVTAAHVLDERNRIIQITAEARV